MVGSLAARLQPRSVTHPWEGLMIPCQLDHKIHNLLERILTEYVAKWYQDISSGMRRCCMPPTRTAVSLTHGTGLQIKISWTSCDSICVTLSPTSSCGKDSSPRLNSLNHPLGCMRRELTGCWLTSSACLGPL